MSVQKFLNSLRVMPSGECSYFPARETYSKIFNHPQALAPATLDIIFANGFRRHGTYYYKPACIDCHACWGYRVPLNNFSLRRSQKKILQKNKDVIFSLRTPTISREKEKIYLRYQYAQHFKKPVAGVEKNKFVRREKLETMHQQMYWHCANSIEAELHLQNKLVGFAVFDVGQKSISAVYSVYEPRLKQRSLGKLMILRSLLWATSLSYEYFYLGLFIEHHRKMNYKKEFQPAEILLPTHNIWQLF